MKIDIKKEEPTLFGDLAPGSVFIVKGVDTVCMKTIIENALNTVLLESGRLCYTAGNTVVTPLPGATLVNAPQKDK